MKIQRLALQFQKIIGEGINLVKNTNIFNYNGMRTNSLFYEDSFKLIKNKPILFQNQLFCFSISIKKQISDAYHQTDSCHSYPNQ